ncbi:MAG TPA: ABC transporter permease [Geminicoccaceae bacterium]
MTRYILGRLLAAIPVLLIVSLISFSLMQLVPGDPAIVVAGLQATPADVERVREQLGLNEPFHIQLLTWYGNLLQGDLGTSFLLGRDVLEVTIERLPVSISIALYALVLTLAVGILAGVIAALRQNTWVDQAVMTIALIGVSLPNFWLGLMLIVLFAVQLGWLPTGGYVDFRDDFFGWLAATTLPAVSLAMLQMGLLARITRSTMLEVLRQDYIRTARAKGLPEYRVVGKHALKNVMIPVVTVIGIVFSLLLSGSVVIETIFSIPGIGSLLGSAILRRDYPVIQGGLLLVASMLLLLNLIVDVLYAWFDPRIRYHDGD